MPVICYRLAVYLCYSIVKLSVSVNFYVCVYNRPTIAPQHEDATEAGTKRLQRAAIAVPISLLDLVVEEMVLWLQSDC